MINQNTTSPALHHQNQPPDSGSVHESQRRQLRLSLHRSHRNTCCVCFCFRVFYNFRGEKRRSLYCSSSSHQKSVSSAADDKSKHNKPSPSPLITRTNLLTSVLHMNHSSSNFGYRFIAVTAIHAVVVVVVVVSHIQRIGCQPEKTTLHGGQSRSWSAEQGKENKRKSLAAYPPLPPTLLVRRK